MVSARGGNTPSALTQSVNTTWRSRHLRTYNCELRSHYKHPASYSILLVWRITCVQAPRWTATRPTRTRATRRRHGSLSYSYSFSSRFSSSMNIISETSSSCGRSYRSSIYGFQLLTGIQRLQRRSPELSLRQLRTGQWSQRLQLLTHTLQISAELLRHWEKAATQLQMDRRRQRLPQPVLPTLQFMHDSNRTTRQGDRQ